MPNTVQMHGQGVRYAQCLVGVVICSLCYAYVLLMQQPCAPIDTFAMQHLTDNMLPMTSPAQAKTRELKNTLNNEFRLIHDLCPFVLQHARKPELLRATLSALHAYLSWVPLGYIFESSLVSQLLGLFPQAPYRNIALQCLTEVGGMMCNASGPRAGQLCIPCMCRAAHVCCMLQVHAWRAAPSLVTPGVCTRTPDGD